MSGTSHPAPGVSYESWLADLQRIAEERGLEWMVSAASGIHRAAFDRGLSAEEEIASLQDLSEWRGCGCGGGGG